MLTVHVVFALVVFAICIAVYVYTDYVNERAAWGSGIDGIRWATRAIRFFPISTISQVQFSFADSTGKRRRTASPCELAATAVGRVSSREGGVGSAVWIWLYYIAGSATSY